MSDDQNMATMPIPELVAAIREKVQDDSWFDAQPLVGFTLGILAGRLMDEHELRLKCEETLEFYADPESYHAIAFISDPPHGPFMEDFDEDYLDYSPHMYDRPMPGKRAREALKPEVRTRGQTD